MEKFFSLAITEISVKLRIGRLVLFYIIDPHIAGVRWWTPEKPLDWTRIWEIDWPKS